MIIYIYIDTDVLYIMYIYIYNPNIYIYIVSGATKKERSQRFHAIFRTHLRSQPLHGVNPSSVEMELALVNLFLPIQ